MVGLFLGPITVGKWPQQEVCLTDTGCHGLLKAVFTVSNQTGSCCQLAPSKSGFQINQEELDLDFR